MENSDLKLVEVDFETNSWTSVYKYYNKLLRPDQLSQINRELIECNLPSYQYDELPNKKSISEPKDIRNAFILEPMCEHDYLSYDIHTNRELLMMVRGEKDFSVFNCEKGFGNECKNDQNFDKFMSEINMMYHCWALEETEHHFYYLSGAHWKVAEYKKLIKNINDFGPNNYFEGIQGYLLGYNHTQNVEFISRFGRP